MFVKIGLMPDGGQHTFCAASSATAKAFELNDHSDIISTQDALALGNQPRRDARRELDPAVDEMAADWLRPFDCAGKIKKGSITAK